MRPICVSMPVAVTRAVARPAVTSVPEITMLVQSPRGASSGSGPPAAFSTGTDSPVIALSSQRSPAASSRRASAGTRSPASSRITSPGTSSAASTRTGAPPRRAVAWGEVIFRSSSRARWAWSSWEMEMMLFTTTMTRMMAASSQSSPGWPPGTAPPPPAAPRSWGPSSGPSPGRAAPAAWGAPADSARTGPAAPPPAAGSVPRAARPVPEKRSACGRLCQLSMTSRSLPLYRSV